LPQLLSPDDAGGNLRTVIELTLLFPYGDALTALGRTREAADRRRLFDLELPQVGPGELDELFAAAGQDRPGRVQAEALDMAVGADPRFAFTDPPFRRSLPMALAFAAAGDRPAAVLTGPAVPAGTRPWPVRPQHPAGGDMSPVSLQDHPLTATAALVWSADLPRPLQQILFDTADGVTSPPACYPEPVRVSA